MKQDKLNQRLHWTTTITEKVMLGGIGGLTVVVPLLEVWGMWENKNIALADLFLLFHLHRDCRHGGCLLYRNRIPNITHYYCNDGIV